MTSASTAYIAAREIALVLQDTCCRRHDRETALGRSTPATEEVEQRRARRTRTSSSRAPAGPDAKSRRRRWSVRRRTQRLSVARAILRRAVLILDDPTSSLDDFRRDRVRRRCAVPSRVAYTSSSPTGSRCCSTRTASCSGRRLKFAQTTRYLLQSSLLYRAVRPLRRQVLEIRRHRRAIEAAKR